MMMVLLMMMMMAMMTKLIVSIIIVNETFDVFFVICDSVDSAENSIDDTDKLT